MHRFLLFYPLGILMLVVTLTGCTDAEGAKRVAEDHGFSQVQITGHRWTGCSDRDTYSTGFKAVGPTGRPVSGVVCSSSVFGWGKSNTLRLD